MAEFVTDLLRLAGEYSFLEDILFEYKDGQIRASVNVSDTFWLATGDDEPVTAETLPDLRRAAEDVALSHKNCGACIGALYAARRRNVMPITQWLSRRPECRPAFYNIPNREEKP